MGADFYSSIALIPLIISKLIIVNYLELTWFISEDAKELKVIFYFLNYIEIFYHNMRLILFHFNSQMIITNALFFV